MKAALSNCFFSFLPSKDQLSDGRLRNRMKLCALAVCLMWSASLKVAVYISSFVVDVPSLSLLYQSCRGALSVIGEEKARHTHCVHVQLDQCDLALDRSMEFEFNRYNATLQANENILGAAEEISTSCLANYTTLRDSLEAWANIAKQPIPINNATCSKEEEENLLAAVGDTNTLKNEIVLLGKEYSAQSQNSVQTIGGYAKIRMDYDKEFLSNYTRWTQEKIQSYIESMQIPQLDVDRLLSALIVDIDALVPCITPSKTHGACQFLKGAPEHLHEVWQGYLDLVTSYYAEALHWNQAVAQYVNNVRDAFEITAAFYNGMLCQYYWKSLLLSSSSQQGSPFCEKSLRRRKENLCRL